MMTNDIAIQYHAHCQNDIIAKENEPEAENCNNKYSCTTIVDRANSTQNRKRKSNALCAVFQR